MTERSFPVPALVYRQAQGRTDLAVLVAGGTTDTPSMNRLSDCQWATGRVWAQSVLRGDPPDDRAMQVALVATGFQGDDDPHRYFGLLDPDYDDHEVIMAAVRAAPDADQVDRWDGTRWEPAAQDPAGLNYVELDPDNLAFVVDALSRGSAGVVLRPTEPRAWLEPGQPIDPTEVLVAAMSAAATVGGKAYAIVDEFDTSAVLELIRVLPGPVLYVRRGKDWVKDAPTLAKLQSVDPPPVVAVGDDVLAAVTDQVDAYDTEHPPKPAVTAAGPSQQVRDRAAARGQALPDGSFPIRNRDDLHKAIRAVGRAKNIARAKAHIKARAKALGLESALPEAWRGVTAAAPWVESKYKRGAGGKFGAKDKAAASKPVKRASLPPIGGSRPDRRGSSAHPRDHTPAQHATIFAHPDRMLDHSGNLPGPNQGGVPAAFWDKQPPGFKNWLTGFLKGMRPKGAYTSKDGKHHAAPGSVEAKQAGAKAANKNPGREAGTKAGQNNWTEWKKHHPNAPDYVQKVPPKYRDAMMAWLHETSKEAAGPGDGAPDGGSGDAAGGQVAQVRRTKAAARDLSFDYVAAKARVAENRQRAEFDTQVADHFDRIKRLPEDERAKEVASLRERSQAEAKRRMTYDRSAKLKADAEAARRLGARRKETLASVKDLSVTADASLMPTKLKKYWITGKGALKIRWGTGGDFNRCRKHLAKYMAPEKVSGACANLHRLATGFYPGPGKKHPV